MVEDKEPIRALDPLDLVALHTDEEREVCNGIQEFRQRRPAGLPVAAEATDH